jgi:hypothetical protein
MMTPIIYFYSILKMFLVKYDGIDEEKKSTSAENEGYHDRMTDMKM